MDYMSLGIRNCSIAREYGLPQLIRRSSRLTRITSPAQRRDLTIDINQCVDVYQDGDRVRLLVQLIRSH